MKKFLQFLVPRGAQCLSENEKIHFHGVLSTLWDQKSRNFCICFEPCSEFKGVYCAMWLVFGAISRSLTAPGRIYAPTTIWAQNAEMGPAGPKICNFLDRNFCRLCLWLQILFGGVVDPKRAGRVQSVCQNKFEHRTTLQSWDFAFWVEKKFAFPP